MQTLLRSSLGVSPAYFLSRFGEAFGPADVVSGLPDIAGLSAHAAVTRYEPEIFLPEALDEWTPEAVRRVAGISSASGLAPSQFVAHFLGNGFTALEALARGEDEAVLARVCDIALGLGTDIVVIPILPWQGDPPSDDAAVARTAEKLARLAQVAAVGGCSLSVELVPGGIIATTSELQAVIDRGAPVGYNCDTGNAVAAGERVEEAALRMAGRIRGTHLCDAEPGCGSSCPPGAGAIDWSAALGALEKAGYTGPLDVEIRCEREVADATYRAAIEYIDQTRRSA